MRRPLNEPRLLLALWLAAGWSAPVWAESPAPSVHWGAIAYPELERTLTAGLTVNRFTQFDGAGKQYNDITQTSGFNFLSASWTERLSRLPGWNSNLTVGAGPTQDGFTRFLQNDVVHKLRNLTPVPVGDKRAATDFMFGGSLTRWASLLGKREEGFAGLGTDTGSLYHEVYGRLGVRRLSPADAAALFLGSVPPWLRETSRHLRLSAMGRYGRLFGGSAYPIVAPQSWLGQVSIGVGDYERRDGEPPCWEVELAFTVDSGLFVDRHGDALEERFVSLALRYGAVTFETWNDLINQKDYGPTFGARLTFDLLRLRDFWLTRI